MKEYIKELLRQQRESMIESVQKTRFAFGSHDVEQTWLKARVLKALNDAPSPTIDEEKLVSKEKDIKNRFYAVEYGGYWHIQTTPYYSEEDILNADMIGSVEAEKNAKLIADLLNKHYSSPEPVEEKNPDYDWLLQENERLRETINGLYLSAKGKLKDDLFKPLSESPAEKEEDLESGSTATSTDIGDAVLSSSGNSIEQKADIIAQEAFRLLPDSCKEIMVGLKKTYIESLQADIIHQFK
jgi:hypothetical protein